MAHENKPVVFIAAEQKDNIDELKEVLGRLAMEVTVKRSENGYFNTY